MRLPTVARRSAATSLMRFGPSTTWAKPRVSAAFILWMTEGSRRARMAVPSPTFWSTPQSIRIDLSLFFPFASTVVRTRKQSPRIPRYILMRTCVSLGAVMLNTPCERRRRAHR